MLQVTPQERLALGVTALLLAAGAASRLLSAGPPAAEWQQEVPSQADTDGRATLSTVRRATEREIARERIRSAPLGPDERIDLNTASEDQLDRLPRVGPDLARRIVEWRSTRGRFRSLADLDSVPGVGPALLREVAPHVPLPAAPGPARGTRGSARLAGAGTGTAGSPGSAVARAGGEGRPLDLNRATAAELDALPGIGPVLAQRIVDWRAANGRFGAVADLEKVPGIGPAMLEKLAPSVRAGP